MLFSFIFIAAALVLEAAATRARSKPLGFIVKQIKNPNYRRNGHAEFAKSVRKFGPGSSLVKAGGKPHRAAAGGGQGSTSANPTADDVEYLSPITVNGQIFKLQFDTGSSDLWLRSAATKGQGSGHNVFVPKKGDTPVKGETWNITYGDNTSAAGNVFSETVNVGAVAVTGQAVEVATGISEGLQTDPSDGLMGLAFSAGNTILTNGKPTPKKTFFQNAIDQKVISKPVMGVTLKHNAAGSFDFGFVRSNGSLVYVPADNSRNFWEFTPAGLKSGGKAISTTSSIKGLADTGTSQVLLPPDVVNSYYGGVQGAAFDGKNWNFPCSATLPDFQVNIVKNTTVTIPGSFINFETLSGGTCTGGIQPNTQVQGINIYGDVFLKATYVVFDATPGKPRLGFAPN